MLHVPHPVSMEKYSDWKDQIRRGRMGHHLLLGDRHVYHEAGYDEVTMRSEKSNSRL